MTVNVECCIVDLFIYFSNINEDKPTIHKHPKEVNKFLALQVSNFFEKDKLIPAVLIEPKITSRSLVDCSYSDVGNNPSSTLSSPSILKLLIPVASNEENVVESVEEEDVRHVAKVWLNFIQTFIDKQIEPLHKEIFELKEGIVELKKELAEIKTCQIIKKDERNDNRDDDSPPAKRRRGRPCGSTNKSKGNINPS